MAKKKTPPAPAQMRLVPEVAPEWEDALIPLDALPVIYEVAPKTLVDSIKVFGVLQPVIIQRDAPGWAVIAGRRRIAGARAAGLEVIPARILTSAVGDINPDTILLIENAERGPNIAAELAAIERLVKDGHSPKDISRATGMRLATVTKRMGLLKLDSAFRNALEDQAITPSVAERLAKLTPDRQHDLVVRMNDGERITLDVVQDAKKVTASGTLQSALAGIVGGMGAARQDATPDVLYARAMTHLERFQVELPADVPPAILGHLTALQGAMRAYAQRGPDEEEDWFDDPGDDRPGDASPEATD